jgi:tetratricopeptide (TPR) repeat protein
MVAPVDAVAVDRLGRIGKTARMGRSGRSGGREGSAARSADCERSHWPGPGRIISVAAAAILIAAEVARITVANASADKNPQRAARFAPFSPPALVSSAMSEVGSAAAAGQDVGRSTLERLRLAAGAAPLQPEPFLVQGAIAERRGDLARAQSLLEMARWRDPRSPAALYLLADVWLRGGNIVQGLRQLALMSRIMPATSVQLVPALADFARAPGARETLDSILRTNPELRRPLLIALSADPANADLAVALSGPELHSTEQQSQAWKARLLRGLVQRGDYDRAYAIWREFAGLPAGFSALLFNGDFKAAAAPAPFNWTFSSGGAGIAEPANGKLRVLFYGNAEQTLASQLLLLKPGNYEFRAPVDGNPAAGALSWTLTCGSGGRPIMDVPLNSSAAGARFAVPAACPSQMLQLVGHLEDMPQNSDVQIGHVQLERVGA